MRAGVVPACGFVAIESGEGTQTSKVAKYLFGLLMVEPKGTSGRLAFSSGLAKWEQWRAAPRDWGGH